MKYSLKLRFWLWIERWSKRIFYYAQSKNEYIGYKQVYGEELDSSSNDYSLNSFWDDGPDLYTFNDGKAIE